MGDLDGRMRPVDSASSRKASSSACSSRDRGYTLRVPVELGLQSRVKGLLGKYILEAVKVQGDRIIERRSRRVLELIRSQVSGDVASGPDLV